MKYSTRFDLMTKPRSDLSRYAHQVVENMHYQVSKIKGRALHPTHYWTLERAISYYGEHDKDGERHSALFVIKNRLSNDDYNLFVDWLRANHPSKMHHWNSHKRIVKVNVYDMIC